MQGKVHVFGIHGSHQATHGLDHDHHIAGFHADDHIVKVFGDKHTQELHHAFHHASRSVAIAAHDAVAQRTVVHPQPNGGAMLAANLDERQQRVADFLDFGAILLIGVGELLEGACRVYKIAGIDAHLVGESRCRKGCTWIEMDVGHQRHIASLLAQQVANHADAFCFSHTLCCEPHVVGTGIYDALALCCAAFGVVGIGVGHGLHPDGEVAAHGHCANVYRHRVATVVIKRAVVHV